MKVLVISVHICNLFLPFVEKDGMLNESEKKLLSSFIVLSTHLRKYTHPRKKKGDPDCHVYIIGMYFISFKSPMLLGICSNWLIWEGIVPLWLVPFAANPKMGKSELRTPKKTKKTLLGISLVSDTKHHVHTLKCTRYALCQTNWAKH